jgi:hypothetical protein
MKIYVKLSMQKYLCILVLFFLSYNNIFSQENHVENKFKNSGWEEADIGVIINKNDLMIEKVFENNIGNKIFYVGAENHGDGIFYIQRSGNRIIILETHIRYDSKIIWHGENIAEIIIPTGSPFRHSYYYNFFENKLSEKYYFPMYYDIDTNYVLVWGNNDFELYDVKTNELIKIYNYRRNNGLMTFYPIINWYIEKENDIIMYWENWDKNISGKFIFNFEAAQLRLTGR